MENLEKIKIVISDVDGVLTDGSIIKDCHGGESKTFNARDGSGIKFLMRADIKFAIISGRTSAAVDFRAKELDIKDVYQGQKTKIDAYQEILSKYGFSDDEVCYIGDDFVDIPVLLRVGFPVAVADATPETQKVCDYVTIAPGGRGAVREVIEKIIKGQDKWQEITARYF